MVISKKKLTRGHFITGDYMIKRDKYLTQLISAKNNGFPKVITGVRRCGKSFLLK